VGRDVVRVLLAAFALMALPGCVIIPEPSHGLPWGRGAVRERDLAALEIGETRREEVFLRLGPPEMALDDERILVYDWGLEVGVVGHILGTGNLVSDCALILEFGDDGRLRRFEYKSDRRGGGPLDRAKDTLARWHPGREIWPRRWLLAVDPFPDLWVQSEDSLSGPGRVRVSLGEFRDARPPGESGTALGRPQKLHPLGLVESRAARPVSEAVRAAVGKQLERQGARIVSADAEYELRGVVESFSVDRGAASFAVTVEAVAGTSPPALRSRYAGSLARSPWSFDLGPGARMALIELQRLVAADRGMARLLGGERRR
jgi:hypothetical protein